MSYALTASVDQSYGDTVEQVRDALRTQGFGILTEIDMRATLKTKLGVEVPQLVILGACNPPLAHAALQAEPSIGLLLRATSSSAQPRTAPQSSKPSTPQTMVALTSNTALQTVADDATRRLKAALDSLTNRPTEEN